MKQIRSLRAFGFALIASMSALMLSAQAGDQAVLQQRLYSQFRLTTTTADRSDIVTPGDVVVIHVPGLLMYAVSSPMPPANTYKNGRISQGWGGFGKDILIGMAAPGGATATDYPHRQFVPEEKCWVREHSGTEGWSALPAVQRSLRRHPLLRQPQDPVPQQKEMPPVDQVMQTVSQVLTVMRQDDQGNQGGQQAQQSPQGQFQGNPAPSAFVPGRYTDRRTHTDFVQFDPSGTLVLFQSGKVYTGTYSVAGDTIVASGPQIKGQVMLHIVGNTVTYQDGTTYENLAAPPQNYGAMPGAAPAPIAPPPPAPLPDIPPPPPPADIAPPPPPADAAPPTIALGQTMDQVTAGFGQPARVARLGAMVIFYYKDMKVTFKNGKVSNVE